MESRVGSLTLQVRAPAEHLDAFGPAAEAFTVRMLTRCDELLEGQAPGRVVLIPNLELSFRLLDGALPHEGEIEAFAGEMAEALDRWARSARETPSGDPEIVVFEDELAWRAAHVEARSNGGSSREWRFDALEAEGEPNRTLLERTRTPHLDGLLARLRKRGTLRSSLAALPADVMDVLVETVDATKTSVGPTGDGETAAMHASAAACIADLPSLTPLPVVKVCIAVAARDILGSGASDIAVAKVAQDAWARFLALLRDANAPATHSGGSDGAPAHDEGGIDSAFGGLFFLLNPALELSVGELLWRACLPEGLVLAHAAAFLLGAAAAGDPAPGLFGGTDPRDSLPEVSSAQQSEVALALLAALGEALPHRAMAELPETVLRLVDTPRGRLLVAAEPDSPFTLFAAPAQSLEETRLALDAFLGVWPASAPASTATPALAELDRRARVRPVKPEPLVNLLLPASDSLLGCALISQVAGSLGHLFTARIGTAGQSEPTDLVARHLSLPGKVHLIDEAMAIRIPIKYLGLDTRRAGLDADPGWVPWLRRHVIFVYEDPVVVLNRTTRDS